MLTKTKDLAKLHESRDNLISQIACVEVRILRSTCKNMTEVRAQHSKSLEYTRQAIARASYDLLKSLPKLDVTDALRSTNTVLPHLIEEVFDGADSWFIVVNNGDNGFGVIQIFKPLPNESTPLIQIPIVRNINKEKAVAVCRALA